MSEGAYLAACLAPGDETLEGGAYLCKHTHIGMKRCGSQTVPSIIALVTLVRQSTTYSNSVDIFTSKEIVTGLVSVCLKSNRSTSFYLETSPISVFNCLSQQSPVVFPDWFPSTHT